MWTNTTRAHHARAGLALPSDLTDAEWAVLEPFFPPPSHVGRPRKWPMRRIVEAILYLLRGGLPWRMLPPCFPPVSTVRRWFYLWRDNGLWRDLNHYLLMASRESEGREASPSAGVIDSQSVKTTESGGPRGYDAGKKIKGRKRHILTDTEGNLVHALIHIRGSNGRVVALSVPIAPELMTVRRLRDGSLEYEWSDNGVRSIAPQDNMLHIRGFGGNPLGGLSTLSFGRQTFGLAQAIERASGDTFRNGVRPSGLLKTADSLTLDQRKQAEELLQEKFAGAINAGRPMLLDRGMDWVQLSISPEDAQMLQSRAFSVEEVCRFFGVPPFMVGHTEKTTSWGTGLEQQTLGFQKFTLRRRLKRIEQALAKQLLSPADRQAGLVIEFNLEGLLRGDSAARASFYQSMLGSGVMTINEVRALENLPPVEGGDVPRMQMQNVPITQTGSGAAPAALPPLDPGATP